MCNYNYIIYFILTQFKDLKFLINLMRITEIYVSKK